MHDCDVGLLGMIYYLKQTSGPFAIIPSVLMLNNLEVSFKRLLFQNERQIHRFKTNADIYIFDILICSRCIVVQFSNTGKPNGLICLASYILGVDNNYFSEETYTVLKVYSIQQCMVFGVAEISWDFELYPYECS